MTIDFSKRVRIKQTHNIVKVLSTDGPNDDRQIIGIVPGNDDIHAWDIHGNHHEDTFFNVEQAPDEHTFYFNYYGGKTVDGPFQTVRQAMESASVKATDPKARVRVTFEEGLFDV